MQLHLVPRAPHRNPASGLLLCPGEALACAIGRTGIRRDKREGDGATPAGSFPLRRVLYRPDRGARPETGLPVEALDPRDGWCDDPEDPAYNTQVRLPHGGGSERLWRGDHLYDIIVVIGHNDDPVVPGAGSAIFLHVAGEGLAPTEGCVALEEPALRRLLAALGPGDAIAIDPRPVTPAHASP
jgi:L,D-peptidoglycan transpeptidase YkuD (ErfK/YbiS/YcfS/YnhG family)